jgi:Beta/Gamma crystallin
MKEKAIYRFVYLLLAVTGFLTIGNAQDPDVRGMGGVGITVFRDRNFQGSAATYTYNVPNLARTGFNNMISSVRVGPGERWEICDLPNYGGQCVVVFGQESDLRENGWNDRISSLRRVSGGGGGVPPGPTPSGSLVLFNQPNYRGQNATYNQVTPNLYGANNRAQSATVSGGAEWQLCQGVNFTGRCITLSRSTPNLANFGMRNRVSSVRPIGNMPPPVPPSGNSQITLFEQKNYLGDPSSYMQPRPNIFKRAQSVTVGAGSWQLCDGSNYTGRCITLNQSVWDLTNYNIGRTIRSIRPY